MILSAVGFFLTAGFLAMMYYFVPKQAERPVYSYRLSIIHFWSLIFLYIWAGPHHLHYTALPDWAQTLGMVYYFVPKQAERPVYSYRLSIIHFWSLIFLYIWAGPHHLHYTALPDWAQTLGMVFSIMLWMPSWGGMINGLMTLNGAWVKPSPVPTSALAWTFPTSLAMLDLPWLPW